MQPLQGPNHTPHSVLARRRGGVFLFTLHIMRGPATWLTKQLSARFHKRYQTFRHARILFTIDLVLVGVIIILAGLTGWIIYGRFGEARALEVVGSTNTPYITSGAPVTFTFWYENKSQEPLDQVVLAIRLPPNFELLRSFPAAFATGTSTLPIGTLAPGERGAAKLFGRLWGKVGTSAPVLVTAPFTSTKSNRRLIVFEKFEFPIQDSVLATSLIIPDRLIAGQAIPFELSYKNNGTELLPEVLVHPILPQGATIRARDHLLSDNAWQLRNLEPDESGVIRGNLELPASPNAESSITIQSSIIRNEVELLQDEVVIPVLVSPSPLLVSATTPVSVAKPGTEVPVDIRALNTGDVPLRDITVSLASTSPAIAANELGPRATLGDLLPNESRTVSYLLPLREHIRTQDLGEGDRARELSITIRPEASGTLEDGLPIALAVSGLDIRLPLETPFFLTTIARYYTPEGDQIGRGPLPPIVGKTTKYWVTWELAPTTNELEGFVVRAKLPPGVEWTGQAHATLRRAPRFEPDTRIVRWTIDRLEPTLPTGDPLVARFEIAITPTEPLRGTIPLLLEETNAQAFDQFTETQLTASTGTLTTALPDDRFIRGRVRVR